MPRLLLLRLLLLATLASIPALLPLPTKVIPPLLRLAGTAILPLLRLAGTSKVPLLPLLLLAGASILPLLLLLPGAPNYPAKSFQAANFQQVMHVRNSPEPPHITTTVLPLLLSSNTV